MKKPVHLTRADYCIIQTLLLRLYILQTDSSIVNSGLTGTFCPRQKDKHTHTKEDGTPRKPRWDDIKNISRCGVPAIKADYYRLTFF
jgi:hypothetical protein